MNWKTKEIGEFVSSEMRVMRIRDILSLILSYPVTLPNQPLLCQWRDQAQALTAETETSISSCMNLLSQNPLRHLKVLIPHDILSNIEDRQPSFFIVPEAVRELAIDLAIHQLIRNLLDFKIHSIRFFTRTIEEKKHVIEKMRAALGGGKQTRPNINEKYSKVLWIDLSNYQNNTEVSVQQEIARQLTLMEETKEEEEEKHRMSDDETDDNEELHAEMMRKQYLVFLMDGDGKGKLDPMKVGFLEKKLGTVVLVTSEMQVEANDELRMSVDLEIRTEDHVLPWELFCRNIGGQPVCQPSAGDLHRIAVEIVEACHGHLLTGVLVARFLKDKEQAEPWRLALKKLHYLHPFNANRIPEDIDKVLARAFTNIILDGLSDEEKLCLGCTLYILNSKQPVADHVLIHSWVYNKIVSAQEKAESVLKNLVDHSILFQLEGSYIQWPS